MIFDIHGDPINSCYYVNGNALPFAYSKNGEQIFADGFLLKVATYNVGQWYYGSGTNVPSAKDAEYYALQNGMIQNADADILFLEEYWKVFSGTGRTARSILEQYYPYIHEQGGDSGYFGRCICSKYPISDYTIHSYSNESSRYYDSCTVIVGDVPITLIITHLATDNKRYVQIGELITYLSGLTRFVCAGDFNTLTITGNGKVTTEAQDYEDIIIPLVNAGFHCANCSSLGFKITYSDEPTGTYTGCLDNIITSSNIDILSAYVDETKLTDGLTERTDHMPLIATLHIN